MVKSKRKPLTLRYSKKKQVVKKRNYREQPGVTEKETGYKRSYRENPEVTEKETGYKKYKF
jgi:hypothetical protein